MDQRLKFFIDNVQRHYFCDFPIYSAGPDEYVGVFMKHHLASRFSELQAGQALALPYCSTPTGEEIAWERLQGLCRASESAVVLDRFIRSIHLLNYLSQPERWQRVFLPVSMALIAGVEKGHGKVFGDILDRLECPRQRIGMLLPSQLLLDAERTRIVAQAYQHHGFATASLDSAGLSREILPAPSSDA